MKNEQKELANKLASRMKKANSDVITAFEAKSGDYRVTISSDSIRNFYRGSEVANLKVAELDDELIDYINENVEDAAHTMLSEFKESFDTSNFTEKTAATKEAAHSTQDEGTWTMTTEKQLKDQKIPLHPRTNEYYSNTTQKQLPEHGQRPGTYDVTTEGQFRDETTTFYGDSLDAGQRRNEDRTEVTERQFDEGVGSYSDVGQSDRGQMGSKFDGDLDAQWQQIGEKQLMELLSHHEWTEPLTVTEGKDQLQKQDGELARITAEIANKILRESLDAIGRTVVATGADASEVVEVINRLTSHDSKLPALANTLWLYGKAPNKTANDVINKKIAKARKLGKVASTDDWGKNVIADVLARQLSSIDYNSKFVVECLERLAKRSDFIDRIEKAANATLEATQTVQKESSVFDQILDGNVEKTASKNDEFVKEGSADDDGLYSYVGSIDEVNADVKDKDAFAKAAASYAINKVASQAGEGVQLVPESLDVNSDKRYFEIIFRDENHKSQTLEARAERRRALAKEAQAKMNKEAQVGGAGGMPPAGQGGGMGNPAPPMGGGDMGMPPAGEALSQEPMPEDDMAEESSGEPKPPGSTCLICGGEDVDVDNGEWRCNNCGGEGTISIKMEATKWPETINETGDEAGDEEGFGLGAEEDSMAEDMGGEGMGTTLPNVPVAAASTDKMEKIANSRLYYGSTVRITPLMYKKIASQKIPVGQVCPNCGGHDTSVVKSASHKGHEGICWACNQEYRFRLQNKDRQVFAQFAWIPKTASECHGCKRNALRQAFVESLKDYGMSWDEFNAKSMQEKGDTIISMANNGCLNIKEAMDSPLPLDNYRPLSKLASRNATWASQFDKFPKATCMERIARKFGENATSMSGPCQGKPLADCVCGQLEGLGIYTDGLAAKVAKVQASKDPMITTPLKECVAMFVKSNYDVADACVACDGLRAAYAEPEEILIETIAQLKPMNHAPMQAKPMAAPMKPMPGSDVAQPMSNQLSEVNAPPAKPMDDGMDPMDEPVSVDLEVSEDLPQGPPDDSMTDDFGSDFNDGLDDGFDIDMDGDMGMEGTVTVNLPQDLAHALEETLEIIRSALGGELGDDMIDNTEESLDMGDVTDDTVGDGDNDSDDIPGLVEEDSDDSLVKSDDPSEGPDESGDSDESGELGGESGESTNEFSDDSDSDDDGDHDFGDGDTFGGSDDEGGMKPMKSNESKGCNCGCDNCNCNKGETKDMCQASNNTQKSVKTASNIFDNIDSQEADLESTLLNMRHGKLKTQQAATDSIFEGLLRQAKIAAKANDDVKKLERKEGGETKVKVNPAQKSEGIGKVQDGGKIQHEEAFSADDPDVPRGKATMGDEGDENTINDKADMPKVPSGDGKMEGEEHFDPELETTVDGNQGAQTTASNKKMTKEASAKTYRVASSHQYHGAFMKQIKAGKEIVKLEDGNTYKMSLDKDNSIVLIAELPEAFKENMEKMKNKGKDPKEESDDATEKEAQNSKNTKESQTVSPKSVKSLEDDPDINQTSGPGKGKVKADDTHSLAVDEKKPSEGMSEPSVPAANNGGQLKREHTYDNKLDGPEIPAGGGSNPDYDTNEKNEPEKLDQTLGKENDVTASDKRNDAIKIAGRMLKENLISPEELSSTIDKLANATPEILKDYEKMIANNNKGLQSKASANTVETPIIQKTANNDSNNLEESIKSLFTLDKRNSDYERFSSDKNTRLYH